METRNWVILVDQDDLEIGTAEKLMAHREGRLHRAFSIFIYNASGQMLLQQRAATKYHSGGLWSNACCSHPAPGSTLKADAHRRLQEEMGFTCPLTKAFAFTYRAAFENGLIEHEYDHVFLGRFDGTPQPDPDEVGAWKWMDVPDLYDDVRRHPERYTAWFRECLLRFAASLRLAEEAS